VPRGRDNAIADRRDRPPAPENLAEAKNAMSAMIAASRGEDGCLDYAYAEDVADPGLIRVSELWRDREALSRHFLTAHLAAWRAAWPRLGISDRDLVLYEVDDPEPV
jgi:quinol monooxygenase YgiN